MPEFIYKGKNLNKTIQELGLLQVTNRNNYAHSTAQLERAKSYFNSIGFPEFYSLIRLAIDDNYVSQFVRESVQLKEGTLQKYSKTFNDVQNFSETASAVAGVSLVFPPLTLLAEGLPLIALLTGVFTSEARTASYDAQQEIIKEQRSIEQLPPSVTTRFFKYVLHVGLYKQERSRPKCQSGSEACSKEHLEYASECKVILECGRSAYNLFAEYFNETNWKKFVDDYDLIKAQIRNIISSQGSGSGSTVVNQLKDSGGCLGSGVLMLTEALLWTYFISQLL